MKKRSHQKAISWLPIDSRILPSLLSFGHVTGLARVFLQIEIILSLLVVIGTFGILLVTVFSK